MVAQYLHFYFTAHLGGALLVRDVLAVNGLKQMVNDGCTGNAA
jgi:hypothetical protein